MRWLFKKCNISNKSKHYTITFLDKTMSPFSITNNQSILVKDNTFKIIDNEQDRIEDNDVLVKETDLSSTNNWYSFFY